MNHYINKIKTFYEIFRANQTLDSKINFLKCIYYNIKPPKWRSREVNFYPISTTLYVNTICNYRCSFCFLINDDHKGNKKFNLDLEKFYDLLEHKHIKYSARITIGGGEPYLNKNNYEFIKELKKRKKIISVYTNGSLIERQYDQMINNQTHYLNISHYDDKFDDLSHMFKAINEDKNKKFISRLSKLVTTDNYKELDDIIDKAIYNSFDRVILQNYFPYKDENLERVIYDDNIDFKNYMSNLIKKYKNKITIIPPNVLKRKNDIFACNNLTLNTTVDSQGSLATCCFLTPPTPDSGNIYNSLEENAWNSEKLVKFRNFIGTKESPMGCKYCYFKNGIVNRAI